MTSAWKRDDGDLIDFSIGQPSKDLLPAQLLSNGLQDVVERINSGTFDVRTMLQYADNRGEKDFNVRLADLLTLHHGLSVTEDQLLTTNGSSSGLDLCCGVFTKPGDTVLVEDPTYFLALPILRDHGLTVHTVDTDYGGMIPDSLEAALCQYPQVRFIYTVPTYGNPTSATLSHARREAISEICERYNVLIVSDDVYQLLSFPGALCIPPPPFPHYTKNGISLGSFSKLLAPGLRLGWIQTLPERAKMMANRGYIASGGGLNPFACAIVLSMMESGTLTSHIDRLRTTLYHRKDALVAALKKHLPACAKIDSGDGGYFVWVWVPGFNFAIHSALAKQKFDCFYTTGARCSPNGLYGDRMRLCYAYYPEEILVEGAVRLGRFIATVTPHQ